MKGILGDKRFILWIIDSGKLLKSQVPCDAKAFKFKILYKKIEVAQCTTSALTK